MVHNAGTEPSVPLPGDDATGRLSRAVDAVIRTSTPPAGEMPANPHRSHDRRAADKALQDEVRSYVGLLRHRGLTPERVLVSVKELVRHTLARGPHSMPRCEAVELLTRIVEWSVSEYYRAD